MAALSFVLSVVLCAGWLCFASRRVKFGCSISKVRMYDINALCIASKPPHIHTVVHSQLRFLMTSSPVAALLVANNMLCVLALQMPPTAIHIPGYKSTNKSPWLPDGKIVSKVKPPSSIIFHSRFPGSHLRRSFFYQKIIGTCLKLPLFSLYEVPGSSLFVAFRFLRRHVYQKSSHGITTVLWQSATGYIGATHHGSHIRR